MEPNEGWIFLHRRIRKHAYWGDPERLRAWLDILLMAAFADHERFVGAERVQLREGQFVASERFLAGRWGWSRGRVRRFLEAARKANEIEPTNDTSDGTIYRVVNYATYQNPRPTNRPGNGTSNGPATDQIDVREKKDTTTPSALAREVEGFCQRVGTDWKLSTELADWCDARKRDAKFMGVDLEYETAKAAEYYEGAGRKVKAPDRALRNWWEKAADDGKTDRGGRARAGRIKRPQQYDYPNPTRTRVKLAGRGAASVDPASVPRGELRVI